MDNQIIKVIFEEGMPTQFNRSLVQWNYGHTLQIEGIELPDGEIEVHFSLTEYDGEAPISIGTVKNNIITVDIPDFILTGENEGNSSYEAYAWIYLTDGECGRTIRKIVFTIEARAKSTTNVPEPDKDPFLEEVRQVLAETKDIAQSVRDDADNGEFDGEKGEPGKSAYQYAQDGGYQKTEEEFMNELANLSGAGQIDEEQLLKFAIKQTTDKAPFHHITDSANYKVLDFGMEGKTEQKTTEGKNLWAFESSYESTGQGFLIPVGTEFSIPAGTYTLSFNASTSDISFDMGFYDANNVAIASCSNAITSGKNTNTFTLSRDATKVQLYMTGAVTLSDIQIEPGSVATPYEPYTNGPSPNPDYPQEIVNAGVMKNLYSGGDVSGTSFVLVTDIEPIPAGTYTISAKVESSDTDKPDDTLVAFLDSSGAITYVHMLPNSDDRRTGTVTLVSEINLIRFYASSNSANSTDDTFSLTDIQIESGSTATDYEPYGYEIGCELVNKNILDISSVGGISSNNADVLVSDGIYGKTVTLSANVVNTAGIVALRGFESSEDTSGVAIITLRGTQGTGRISETATVSKKYHHYAVRIYSYASWNLTDIQLELGSVATDYTPHASQQFTLTSPVPLTKWDYLTKRDGVWGWSIWSDSGIFDGSSDELWVRLNSSNEVRSIIRTNSVENKVAGKENTLCSHFWQYHSKYPTNYHLWLQAELYNACSGTNSAGQVYFNVSPEFTTIDEWRAWLAENPIALLWETSEEQAFHPLPDEEQTLLNNLETYYGVTNLYNDQGCPMWLTYVADTKLYTDKKIAEQIAQTQALILEN